jgi:hypothetical protein
MSDESLVALISHHSSLITFFHRGTHRNDSNRSLYIRA